MAPRIEKPVEVTPEVKAETPKVVIKETPAPAEPELSEQTKAEQAAGREALKAHAK